MDWKGLLKWSLKYSDGTSDTPQMSEEDIDFFRKSIQEHLSTMKNPIDIIKGAFEAIRVTLANNNVAATASSLDLILQVVDEDPESARILVKLDVADVLISLLTNRSVEETLPTLKILATTLQNNPELQKDLHSRNIMRLLMIHLKPTIAPQRGADKPTTTNAHDATHAPSKIADAAITSSAVASGAPSTPTAATAQHALAVVDPPTAATAQHALAVVDPPTAATAQHALAVVDPPTAATAQHALAVVDPPTAATAQHALAVVDPRPVSCATAEEASRVMNAALGALSALVRHNVAIEKDFIAIGGAESVAVALHTTGTDSHKVQLKALNLLRALLAGGVLTPKQVLKGDMCGALLTLLQTLDVDETGIALPEVVADFLVELLKAMRIPLARAGILDQYPHAVQERLAWLAAQTDGVSEDTQHEQMRLKELLHLLKVLDFGKKAAPKAK